MTIKLDGKLPAEADRNGLDAIHDQLMAEPHQLQAVIMVIDRKSYEHDDDGGQDVPKARIRAVEAITAADLPVANQAGHKPRLMPLDAEPDDDGNVAAHPGQPWEPARVVQPGDPLRDGERRFRTHFETCASPGAFRKRRARNRPVFEPGQPAQPALFPATETSP